VDTPAMGVTWEAATPGSVTPVDLAHNPFLNGL
jgi:hypothetical protein